MLYKKLELFQQGLCKSIGAVRRLCNLQLKRTFSMVKFKGTLLLSPRVRFFLKYYFLFILFIRSFFMSNSRIAMSVPASILLLITFFFPERFTYIDHMIFWFAYGFNLLVYDELGSWISSYTRTPEGLWFFTYLTVSPNTKQVLVRHAFKAAFTGLFLGKTAMTSTGRAAIFTGVCAGGFMLTNSYFDRKAANVRAAADREAENVRAAADREAENVRAAADREAANVRAAAARAVEQQKIALEQERLAFEKQKYADQTIKKSRWW